MQLTTLDWVIVIVSIVLSFAPAIYLMRRAGSSTTEFFTSGRAAPWWLIGGSMVATTFSTDTPNLVTNLVRERGVANNWVWWAFLLTGMSTVFFYARMWRRSGVLTDLEFYEIRYSGKAAAMVRAFRAVYLGLFFNIVIMATVNLAAAKIANVLLGWPMWQTLGACAVINIAFASIAGLVGRADHRRLPVRDRDDGVVRRRLLLAEPAAGRRTFGLDRADPAVDAAAAAGFQRLAADAVGADPAADDLVVVGVVSRLGAGRRQLHRAAHPRLEEREGRARRHAVLQRRPLRAAPVAVDHRRALVDAGVSRRSTTSRKRSRISIAA